MKKQNNLNPTAEQYNRHDKTCMICTVQKKNMYDL